MAVTSISIIRTASSLRVELLRYDKEILKEKGFGGSHLWEILHGKPLQNLITIYLFLTGFNEFTKPISG